MTERTISSDLVLVIYIAWIFGFFAGIIVNYIVGIVIAVIIIVFGMLYSFISYIKVLKYSTRVLVSISVIRNLYKEPDLRWLTIVHKQRIGSLTAEHRIASVEINQGLDEEKEAEERKRKEAEEKVRKERERAERREREEKEKKERRERKEREEKERREKREAEHKDPNLDQSGTASRIDEQPQKSDLVDITSDPKGKEHKLILEGKVEKESIPLKIEKEVILEKKPEKQPEKKKQMTIGELSETLKKEQKVSDMYITELIIEDEEWGKILVLSEVPFDSLSEIMTSPVPLRGREAMASAIQINFFALAQIRDVVHLFDKEGFETEEEVECMSLIAIVTDSDFHSENIAKGMITKPLTFADVKMAVELYQSYKAVDLARENKQLKEQIEEMQFLNDQMGIQGYKIANRMLENFGERKDYQDMIKKKFPSPTKEFITEKKNTVFIVIIVFLTIMMIIAFLV